jgi:septal ring factor EnvC (AmiA/AmiB activator)
MKYSFTILVLLLIIFNINGQQYQPEIEELKNELRSIQVQIQQLEAQLKASQKELNEETQALSNLDQQITLIQTQIRMYQSEIGKKSRNVTRIQNEIDDTRKKIAALQEVFAKQILFAYKHQRGKQLGWLLGAKDLTDMMVRNRYFQIISISEKNSYEHLVTLQLNLKQNEQTLVGELNDLNMLLIDSKAAEINLKSKRESKSEIVNKVKKNKTLTQNALNAKRESEQQLLNLIVNLEKGRSTRQLNTSTQLKWEQLTGSFARNRGKLNWPVQGKILHDFGRYKNPQLNTVLNNSGIDIRATSGAEVRCIFSGVISLITYMSGFGNTIIIDHNDGFYTVYAHLSEVLVNNQEFVEAGTVIGSVGESGSLEGAKLHFEIYGNNTPLNPTIWLIK